MAKRRWWDREILELVSTEFRDRSIEYYRYAIESGICCVNGKPAKVGTIIKNGDRIENIVHRHEPPVTSIPVKVLQVDQQKELIVIDKPGSIPVHAVGRYYKNSLIEILQNELGFEKVYPVNRLDRLTSGCMIMALSPVRARQMCDEFLAGSVRKEYVARCRGRFPEDEVTCEKPLLTVDKQMGLNIVHPEGKPAKTVFNRLFYDSVTDTSVLHCRPFTGRSHQIRVHLQYLGHPVANDPVYSNAAAFGPRLGTGGIDTTPSTERLPPPIPTIALSRAPVETPPSELSGNQYLGRTNIMPPNSFHKEAVDALNDNNRRTLLPRETGEDIGFASPVPLSAEAVKIIMALRNMKDCDEDWGRWRDNVFKGKKPLVPPLPAGSWSNKPAVNAAAIAARRNTLDDPTASTQTESHVNEVEDSTELVDGNLYCKECYLPLHPDPPPGKLFIFLHALRYTTSHGPFETEMPWWASKDWTGDGWTKYD
ncbi:pseudouridine synthase [Serendipita vermifera]|nr:pseudouridine synthase [Serendipita vermifera]